MIKLYKIGQVADLCNVSIKALRYYEELKLIKPSNVDIYTGYRYYDEENVSKIKQIMLLKDLNFSLQEIAEFDFNSLTKKKVEIIKEIQNLQRKLEKISSYKVEKGEIVMKKFENDERVIGKWVYEATALSKDKYLEGDIVKDEQAAFQELYFIPNGKGYWVLDGWTKGEIYHYKGWKYTYEIVNGKLLLNYNDNITLVYNKENDNIYTPNSIKRVDKVDYKFVTDEKLIGNWVVVDFVHNQIDNIENFDLSKPARDLYIKKLDVKPNGEINCVDKSGNQFKCTFTKGYILTDTTASKYKIINENGETYLVFEWKAGDYEFTGKIYGCYVMKKVK